jgi:threonine synthase
MDISKASNFERFVFDLLGRDAARTRQLFGTEVPGQGCFALQPAEFARIGEFGFVSGRSTHADRLATIRDAWQRHGQLIDPHTADGLKVAREQADPKVPMIVLETALPAKFAATIQEALDMAPPLPAGLEDLESRPRRFQPMPNDVQAVKRYIAEHDFA